MNFYLPLRLLGLSILLILVKPGAESIRPLPPEDCANALDDDDDGLVDLNDPDCECLLIEPVSRIPNPSFEDRSCCPGGITQLHCADTWIQASAPTTDYLNTCGWMGWEDLPPPLPFPDGNAAVGFRDGRNINGTAEPWWKEYVGACLLAPLLAGIPYRIEFYVGFTYGNNSPAIPLTFFGTTDCANLPFGGGNDMFGCPTNGPGWSKLGEVTVNGNSLSWVKTRIDITPTEDIYAIAIGPACADRPYPVHLYYFIDNLILDEQASFNYQITTNGEHPCSNTFSLQVPEADSLDYQWYRDGVALLGETRARLPAQGREGNYQVRISGADGCKVTNIYTYTKPVERSVIRNILCEDESFRFGSRDLALEGTYFDTLKSIANCDSIVQLNLVEAKNQFRTIDAKIFETEKYKVGAFNFTQPGTYPVHLTSSAGCDSLVTLNLAFYKVFSPTAFSPNGDGVNDLFVILGEADLVEIRSLLIFDKWGNEVYAGENLAPGDPLSGWDGKYRGQDSPPGVYAYTSLLLMDDGLERRFSGTVTLVR